MNVIRSIQIKIRIASACLICCIACIAGHGQQAPKTAFHKGGSVIMAGYGIGNIWKTFLNNAVSNIPGISYKVTAFGPVTLVYEYGVFNRISGGVVVAYSKLRGKYSGYGELIVDELTIFTAMARANYHFGHSAKFDPYIGGGIGYVHSKYNNDQSASRNSTPGMLGLAAQVGARRYFSPVFGLFAEAGYVNGSFGQLGVSVKF